jgi:hypothetical protein
MAVLTYLVLLLSAGIGLAAFAVGAVFFGCIAYLMLLVWHSNRRFEAEMEKHTNWEDKI